VQVYVDDIVFGGSSKSLVARFAEDMSREFEMSMMGELQFFLGLQIKQSKEGTFVHQDSCCSQLLWISYTMSDFGEEYTHVPLQCDSTNAISVAKNLVLPSKTKHIEVRYHFLRDNVEKGKIALIHVPTHDQLADIFTKPLNQATFTRLRGELGVCLIS
jgi:hypothetical protein